MRNLIFINILALVVITSFIIYSCSKEVTVKASENSIVTKNRVVNNMNVYPVYNYVIWQIDNKPYTVIFTSVGTNNHIWIVKNESNFSNESITQAANAMLGFYDKSYLKLNFSSNELVYSLANGVYKNYPANAVGLSKVIDDNLLNSLRNLNNANKDHVIDDVSEKAECKKDGTDDKSCKCAGGANSILCECSGSIASVSWHEQVSCKDGYYACCPGL